VEGKAVTPTADASNALNEGHANAHPLSLFGLDSLFAGAARLRPDAIAICDHGPEGARAFAFAELDQMKGAFAAKLRQFELAPGARALLCCPPRAKGLVAFDAMLACGVEPVLAPLRPEPSTLAALANAAQAEALFAPAGFCGVDLEPTLLALAAQSPSIRLIGCLSENAIDGAADFSPRALQSLKAPRGAAIFAQGPRIQVGAPAARGASAFLTEGALVAAALEFLRKTRRGGAAPIVSLVSLGSFGGLIAAPLAALLSGAPLHFLAPFRAQRFLSLLAELGPARLVAPAAILPDLERSGLLTNGALLSCSLVSQPGAEPLNAAPSNACPLIEIAGATSRVLSAAEQARAAMRVA